MKRILFSCQLVYMPYIIYVYVVQVLNLYQISFPGRHRTKKKVCILQVYIWMKSSRPLTYRNSSFILAPPLICSTVWLVCYAAKWAAEKSYSVCQLHIHTLTHIYTHIRAVISPRMMAAIPKGRGVSVITWETGSGLVGSGLFERLRITVECCSYIDFCQTQYIVVAENLD